MGQRKAFRKICKKMAEDLTGREVICKFTKNGSFSYDFTNDRIYLDDNYIDVLSLTTEKLTAKIFEELGIHVKHPMTYTMLHEIGHLVTNEEQTFSDKDFKEYEIDSTVLGKLVEADKLDWLDSMRIYYTLKLEKEANLVAVRLFQTFPDIIAKYDRKFCKLFPIEVA